MARAREKSKNRKTTAAFLAIPKNLLDSEQYASLSAHAVKLFLDLGAQFNGKNNGDLCLAWSLMNPRGWKSKSTLHRAKDELMNTGFITLTRQGGKHVPSLYALTFKSIDECDGKLEVTPTITAPNTWKKNTIAAPYAYR